MDAQGLGEDSAGGCSEMNSIRKQTPSEERERESERERERERKKEIRQSGNQRPQAKVFLSA